MKAIDAYVFPLTTHTHTHTLLLAQRSALRPKDTSVIGGELQCEASESYTGAEEYWCT